MQTLKLVSQCVVFLAVKLNLLFTESACTYILLDKNSLFYLFIFLFSYLLNSAADHNIFIYQFLKAPSSRFRKKKNKNKNHISLHHTSLSWCSLQSLGCTFIWILASVQHCCTIIFIWGLNILEELEPSFLLSCHFPPWKWRAYGRHPPWILKQQEGPDFNSYILSSVTHGIFCSCKAKDVIRICHTDGA